MLNSLRATARFFSDKVGWSRIGVALSITIIAVAVVVLYRILHDIDTDEVLDAIEATQWRQLITAGIFVAAGYLTLTFYDLFARAHDRAPGRAVSHRCARRLHQLRDRSQCRRQRVYRRCGALPHLFGLGPERRRGRQAVFRRRASPSGSATPRCSGSASFTHRRRRARSITCRFGSIASSPSAFLRCSPPT